MNSELSQSLVAKELALTLAEDLLKIKDIELPIEDMLDSLSLANAQGKRINGLNGNSYADALNVVEDYKSNPTGTNIRRAITTFAPLAFSAPTLEFGVSVNNRSKAFDRSCVAQLSKQTTQVLRGLQQLPASKLASVIESYISKDPEQISELLNKLNKVATRKASPSLKSIVYSEIIDKLLADKFYFNAVDKLRKKTKRAIELVPNHHHFEEHIYNSLYDKYGLTEFAERFAQDYLNSDYRNGDSDNFADEYFVRRVCGITPESGQESLNKMREIKQSLIKTKGVGKSVVIEREIESLSKIAAFKYVKKYSGTLPRIDAANAVYEALGASDNSQVFDMCYNLCCQGSCDKDFIGAVAKDFVSRDKEYTHTTEFISNLEAKTRKAEKKTRHKKSADLSILDYEVLKQQRNTRPESDLIKVLVDKKSSFKVAGVPESISKDYKFDKEYVKSQLVGLIGDIAKDNRLSAEDRISQIEELVQGYEIV